MEEEFEAIEVEYAPLFEGHEIDVDYEFHAPQFFDFTLHETFWDASEAEKWFDFAPSYPPSPFLLKMRWRTCSPSMETEQVSNIEGDDNTRLEDCHETNGKTKPLSKSNSSRAKDFSFMKPTASHLAKQKNHSEIQSPESLRFQRQNSSSTDGSQLTKRQKLEAGYLRKVARLKHHILFTHKKIKEIDRTDVNSASKSNVTIAKEPNLVTALRAHRHKHKTNAESGGPTQSGSQVLKAKPLNKKTSEGPAQIISKMKTPRPTEFQEFYLRTSQRAMQNTSNNAGSSLNCNSISNSETLDLRRTNSSSRQEKCRTNNKLRGSRDDKKQLSSKSERGVFRNIKVYPLEQNDKGSLNEPPTELFSKLSLASEVKRTTKSPSKERPISKGLKENRGGSGSQLQEHENMKLVKQGIQGPYRKQYQSVNDMGSLISKQTCMLEI